MKAATLLVLLCMATVVLCASYEGHRVLTVSLDTVEQLDSLKLFEATYPGISFWNEKFVVPGTVDVQVSPLIDEKFVGYLEGSEYEYSVLHADLQADIDNLFVRNAQASQTSNFFSNYATFDQMQTFLSQLQANYTSMSSLVNVGTTLEGRPITGIVISSNTGSQDKPKIIINGCQHAREWISPMSVAYVAQYLLANYTTSSSVQNLVDNFEWTVIPIVNGDGYVYTWDQDRLWRKNRRNNANSNCYGVDLNRNWDFQWGTDGSGNFPCQDTYAGPSGFSEPEETALANYIGKEDNVVGYIDFHAYGALFMYPWGYVCDSPTPDSATQNQGAIEYANAAKQVNGITFTTGPICDTIYPASGDSADWVYGDGGVVYSYACELRGNSFILPPEEIIPSGEETFAGVVAWATYIDSQVNN